MDLTAQDSARWNSPGNDLTLDRSGDFYFTVRGEHFALDRTLLQGLQIFRQRALDNVAKELLTSLTAPKGGALKHSIGLFTSPSLVPSTYALTVTAPDSR